MGAPMLTNADARILIAALTFSALLVAYSSPMASSAPGLWIRFLNQCLSEQFHNGCQYYVRSCSLTYPQPGIGYISTGKRAGDCPTRTRPGKGGQPRNCEFGFVTYVASVRKQSEQMASIEPLELKR